MMSLAWLYMAEFWELHLGVKLKDNECKMIKSRNRTSLKITLFFGILEILIEILNPQYAGFPDHQSSYSILNWVHQRVLGYYQI